MTLTADAKRIERKPPPWAITYVMPRSERERQADDALEACTQRAWFAEQDGRGPKRKDEP